MKPSNRSSKSGNSANHPLKRVKTQKFEEVQDNAEEEGMRALENEAKSTLCIGTTNAMLMLYFLYKADPPNCGDDTRGLIWFSVILRVGICNAVYLMFYFLARCKILAANTARIFLTTSW